MESYQHSLFVSPKQGGILQSSGFLDLKSLMALNRTCKANMIDELSLIQWIENEITRRHHGVETMQEAIAFCRTIFGNARLKQWLERDSGSIVIKVTRDMLSAALLYEVMLAKMLRTVSRELERVQLVGKEFQTGRSLLHVAALAGRAESIKTILAVYPESERLHNVHMQDQFGWTALHCAVSSNNYEFVKLLLALHSETERLRAVNMQDRYGNTVLHCAARLGNRETIETILAVYPESERLQVVNTPNRYGETVLHCVAKSKTIESIKTVLSLYPDSERMQTVNVPDRTGNTVLNKMNKETRESIMEWLSQSESSASKRSPVPSKEMKTSMLNSTRQNDKGHKALVVRVKIESPHTLLTGFAKQKLTTLWAKYYEVR